MTSTTGASPLTGVFGGEELGIARDIEYEMVSVDGQTAVDLTGNGVNKREAILNRNGSRGKAFGVRCRRIQKALKTDEDETDEDDRSLVEEVDFNGTWNMSRAKVVLKDKVEVE